MLNLKRRTLVAVLALQLVGGSFAHAFEQGSYFVFSIVESAEAKPVDGRIAIPTKIFAKKTTETAFASSSAPKEQERSEFEIDFTQIMPPQRNGASFEFDATPEAEPDPESTNFNTETFDLVRPSTVFGQ